MLLFKRRYLKSFLQAFWFSKLEDAKVSFRWSACHGGLDLSWKRDANFSLHGNGQLNRIDP
jgi:hypothetical protein